MSCFLVRIYGYEAQRPLKVFRTQKAAEDFIQDFNSKYYNTERVFKKYESYDEDWIWVGVDLIEVDFSEE